MRLRIALVAAVAARAVPVLAGPAGASTTVSKPGVHVACTNAVTGNQFVNLTLPTTAIKVGTFTHGKVSCTVTSATFTGSSGRVAVHVTCVNTVTGKTIVDRTLRTAGIHPGVYLLGKVSCTVTPVT